MYLFLITEYRQLLNGVPTVPGSLLGPTALRLRTQLKGGGGPCPHRAFVLVRDEQIKLIKLLLIKLIFKKYK